MQAKNRVMKRFLSIISFSVLFSIAILLYLPCRQAGCYIAIFAQDFNSARAYQDYLYNYNLYRNSHNQYLAAKSEYQTYHTLTSQERAIKAIRFVFKNRAEAWRTYLLALRTKLTETTGIINYSQNIAYLKLDLELQWLPHHQDSLNSVSNEELFKLSEEFAQRQPKTEVVVYQALGLILSGKENSLRERILKEIEKIETKLKEMKSEGEEIGMLEDWLSQAKKKISLSTEKQIEAENKLKTINEEKTDKKEIYLQVHPLYAQTNQNLQEATSFLLEIIEEIKYEP